MNTIRPKIALYSGIAAGAVTLIAIVPTMAVGAWAAVPNLVCTLTAIDIAIWLLFVNPRIEFDENRVRVTNPLRVFSADWAAIKGFETKFGLALVSESKKFVAWSAPAPSRREVRRITKHDLKGTSLEHQPFIEPGLIHAAESGAAYWQLEAFRSKAPLGSSRIKITPNYWGIAGLLVIGLLAYIDLHL